MMLQRNSRSDAAPAVAPPIEHEVLRSPGEPLDVNPPAAMDTHFGHDFSRVRLHTDARAAVRSAPGGMQASGRQKALGRDFSGITVVHTPESPSSEVPGPSPLFLRRLPDHPAPYPVSAGELRGHVGPGVPLPQRLGAEFTAESGCDLSRVRIHSDRRGDLVARALGANALAFGENIAVRSDRYRPETAAGRELLRHEALHIADGAGQATSVQLQVSVDDLAGEMKGMTFILRTAHGTVAKGERVEVLDWNGTSPEAKVKYDATASTLVFNVPKLELDPDTTATPGVRRYDVGVSAQQRAVEKKTGIVEADKKQVQKLKAEESKFTKNHKYWEAQLRSAETELSNQEVTLAQQQKVLSQLMVRQTMYNRFDPIIAKWVDHYNKELKPKEPCDPNIVKSMMFKETRIGTEAAELSTAPATDWSNIDTPFHSHKNVLMNIQSSGEQQLIMLKEMAPEIYKKHHLDEFEKKQKPKEWNDTIIWGNTEFRAAVQEMFQKKSAGNLNLMGHSGAELQEDYEFWIRTGIRWLFFKYFLEKQESWTAAVRAYNGRNATGTAYAKEVMGRVGSSKPLDVSNK